MKFKKYLRFNEPYWFNGIYKITSYNWFNGFPCKTCYQCFYLPSEYGGWGNYINRSLQYNKKLTFKQAVNLCAEHSKTYKPTIKQLKQADKARKAWIKD